MKRLSVSHFANWEDLVKLLGTWGMPVGKVELFEVTPGIQHVKLEADLIGLPTSEPPGKSFTDAASYEPEDEDIPF